MRAAHGLRVTDSPEAELSCHLPLIPGVFGVVPPPQCLNLSFITYRARYTVTPSRGTVLLPRATKSGFAFPSLVSCIPSALQYGCAGSGILANGCDLGEARRGGTAVERNTFLRLLIREHEEIGRLLTYKAVPHP